MDRRISSSSSRSTKDATKARRRSAQLYTTPTPDDTPRQAAGGMTRSIAMSQSSAQASPRSYLGNGTLPGLSDSENSRLGTSSLPASPEPSRRKRLGLSKPIIANFHFSSDEEKANGSSQWKSSRPQTMIGSSGPVDPYTQWRLGRGRRRSSSANKSRPGTSESAHTAGPPSPFSDSPQPLRVQTQSSESRPSTSSRKAEAINQTLAALNGTPAKPPDARKLLLLMNTTKGRMHGKCLVLQHESPSWTSALVSIDAQIGALAWTPISVDSRGHKLLIRNLRGCRVQALFGDGSMPPQLLVSSINGEFVRLRAETHAQFEAWFASFLCWHSALNSENPQGQGGVRRLAALPFLAGPLPKKNEKPTMRKDVAVRKDGAIIKVGKLLYLDPDSLNKEITPTAPRDPSPSPEVLPPWRRVSCIIRESGELLLYTTETLDALATIQLCKLTRSAVQRLHSSMFAMDNCIALYPQYSDSADVCSRVRPIFLGFEARVLFESWFVLLRAFTLPEIYGSVDLMSHLQEGRERSAPATPLVPSPHESSGPPTPMEEFDFSSIGLIANLVTDRSNVPPGLFRLERTLHVQVGEARLQKNEQDAMGHPAVRGILSAGQSHSYVRIFLDGQVKAKTTIKPDDQKPFWYESFEFIDLGPISSSVTFQLKTRSSESRSPTEQNIASQRGRHPPSYLTEYLDPTYGEANIDLNQLEPHTDIDKWLPLLDRFGRAVGEISLKIRVGEEIILMDKDYTILDGLLGDFSNNLTFQIAEKIPSELSRLSEVFLNIYQASNKAEDWLMSLAEEEIDGVRKEAPLGRLRMDSHDSRDARETQVREENKSALAEANLLFRGNTLLSKALDLHMKRLGKEYLEEVLGSKLRAVAYNDLDCEVDPVKLGERGSLQQNWDRLVGAMKSIWKSIAESADRCPSELRLVFRHIRSCAEDRYGDHMRSVSYTSVSGFLFLRFFCPAVLNPRLFGLLKENPTPRSQRTFTLLAKSLQGLANQTLFGTKEPWMSPMNTFLTYYRSHFRDFIDDICSVPVDGVENQLPASYSAPRAIFSRLPPSAKEGFPRTPYLIDHCRNLAALVNLWMDSFPGPNSTSINAPIHDPDLRQFVNICRDLRLKAQASLAHADRVEKGVNTVSDRWITIAERMEQSPEEFYLESEPSDFGLDKYSYRTRSESNRSPVMSIESEVTDLEPEHSHERYDELNNSLRERPRDRTPMSASPYLGTLLTSGKDRSTTSIDTPSTNAASPAGNNSRAPSRASSSMNLSVRSMSDNERPDPRENRRTIMPKARDQSQGGEKKERSGSRFTLFGGRKKKAKEGEPASEGFRPYQIPGGSGGTHGRLAGEAAVEQNLKDLRLVR